MKLEPITFRCLFLPFDCQLNISEVFFNIEVLKDYFDDKGWARVLFEYESKIKMSTCSVWDFIFYENDKSSKIYNLFLLFELLSSIDHVKNNCVASSKRETILSCRDDPMSIFKMLLFYLGYNLEFFCSRQFLLLSKVFFTLLCNVVMSHFNCFICGNNIYNL